MLTKKTLILCLLGNILEYYDFLLFAHLGFIITPLYFPEISNIYTHLLSLFLFGLAFITRPIGGWFFGSLADTKGRKKALTTTILAGAAPAFGLALLPTYFNIGIIAPVLFILLRLWQGFALGGEYPTAGTYLIEQAKDRPGLLSGILCGSANIGSLLGLGMAYLCLQDYSPTWLWRVGFLLGGLGSVLSYQLRYFMKESTSTDKDLFLKHGTDSIYYNRILTVFIGASVAIMVYLPVTYTNFYITKLLNYTLLEGLKATSIALISYLYFCIFFGWIADKVGYLRLMKVAAFVAGPLSMLFFYLLVSGYIWQAQIGLTMIAGSFGAPIHVLMNQLYPQKSRAFNVALFFMIGTSIGGLAPSLSAYLVDATGQQLIPSLILSFILLSTYLLLKWCSFELKELE